MLEECLEYLSPDNCKSVFADMTFGAGGHSHSLLNLNTENIVYAVDQDPDVIRNAQNIYKNELDQKRIRLLQMNFHEFPLWCQDEGLQQKELSHGLDGILMDLGVSSHQFDNPRRGFSFRYDAPLDMRMNYKDGELTAREIVNTYTEEDLANIIYKYGEERLSRRIARLVAERRINEPIETTKELEDICFHAYPKKMRFGKTHPATRTFQALRIEVNAELDVLEHSIVELYKLLKKGGRLAIISFHSLEDRVVKHKFKAMAADEELGAKILTKRPVIATEAELKMNPRSRSAKLRVIEKT